MRPTAEKRHNDWKKALRKRRIDREKESSSIYHQDWYNNLHQYSKNKIHCSCPLCATRPNKTNSLASLNLQERRQRESMEAQEKDLQEEVF